MTLGPRAPLSVDMAFADTIAGIERRLGELERLVARLGVQSGAMSTTTNGSGDVVVTFPAEFPTTPVVVVQRTGSATSQLAVHVTAVSATGFTARFTSNDAVQASTAVTFGWLATI